MNDLCRALATECRYYRRPEDRRLRQDDRLLAAHVQVKDQLAAATARIKVLEELIADLRRQLTAKPTPPPGKIGTAPTVVIKRRRQ
jgi:hypothetical protein